MSKVTPDLVTVRPGRKDHTMKILIVDDDPVCQRIIQATLEKYGECDLVSDGREALDAFASALQNHTPYDLITMDIVMPGMNGREVLEGFRQIAKDQGITHLSDSVRILIMTSMDDTENFLKAMKCDCREYIVKPFTREELIEKVEACCAS